jgi:D-alanyl-D-alanine dipeptidase
MHRGRAARPDQDPDASRRTNVRAANTIIESPVPACRTACQARRTKRAPADPAGHATDQPSRDPSRTRGGVPSSGRTPNRHAWHTLATLALAIIASAALAGCGQSTVWRTGKKPPPPPLPSDLVDIKNVDPTIVVDMRYASANNFTGQPIYPLSKCYLRRDVADHLHKVQTSLQQRALGLKVWDCYRPFSVQETLWAMKPDTRYVARPVEKDGIPVEGSKHNRGAAVDVTLVDSNGNEQPMPTDFDDFSERAHRNALRGIGKQALRNMRILEVAMVREGFEPLSTEWWHFDGPGWEKYDLSNAPLQ